MYYQWRYIGLHSCMAGLHNYPFLYNVVLSNQVDMCMCMSSKMKDDKFHHFCKGSNRIHLTRVFHTTNSWNPQGTYMWKKVLGLQVEPQRRFHHFDTFVRLYYRDFCIGSILQHSPEGTRNMLLLVGLFCKQIHVYMGRANSFENLPPPKQREPDKAIQPTKFHCY